MIPSHSFSPESNPYKRQRLSESPHHRYSSHYPSSYTHRPSLADLAQDRLASRTKLQSTWEDIIQKYSAISSSEADEIDLETGEIVIDHGHLKSLHDSALWDPIDSEPEYDEEEDELVEPLVEEYTPEIVIPQEEPKMPSEQEILKQFGEEYGREILAYLQQRNSSVPVKTVKNDLWTGPADEDVIFNRAKELWRQYQLQRPSSVSSHTRKFDKDSFERAVFGSFESAVFGASGPRSRTAFEEVVFGQQRLQHDWTDEEEGVFGQQREWMEEIDGGFKQHRQGQTNFEDIIFGQHQQEWIDVEEATLGQQASQRRINEEEARINSGGRSTRYAIDELSLESKPRRTESPIRKRTETPATNRKRIYTPSSKSVIRESSSTRTMSARAKEKLRGNVVSGLIIDGSDEEEEDFFSQTPVKSTVKERNGPETPFWSKIGMGNHSPLKMTSQSPLNMRRSQNGKTVDDGMRRSQSPLKLRSRGSSRVRSQSVKTVDDDGDDDDIIILDIFDTNGKCGDVGYRCSKAFCFKCVA